MLKKLRLKFVAINMAIVTAMLCVMFSLVYGFTRADLEAESVDMLQRIAEQGLKLYFIGSPFAGFNIIVSMYFTSVEYPLPAHVISLLRGFAVIIPMAFLLSAVADMAGVWCAFPCTELLVAIVGAVFPGSRKIFSASSRISS